MGSYLIGWRSNPVTEEAVARALAGAAPITGQLPISIPPLYARGWGVERRVSHAAVNSHPTRETP